MRKKGNFYLGACGGGRRMPLIAEEGLRMSDERVLYKPDSRAYSLLLAVALAAVVTQSALGQASAVVPQAQSTEPQLPTFEVATIKPSDPNAGGSRLMFIDDQFVTKNQSAKAFIKFAYNLNFGSDQVTSGGPAWVESAKFDITAKMDEETVAAMQKTDSRTADGPCSTDGPRATRGQIQSEGASRDPRASYMHWS